MVDRPTQIVLRAMYCATAGKTLIETRDLWLSDGITLLSCFVYRSVHLYYLSRRESL